jgi:tetratricopeptide (TPR) repeat protein
MTSDIECLMPKALSLLQQGRPAEAERLYRQILAAAPRHTEALHMLGIIALQQRRFEDADCLIHESLTIRPDNAEALSNRATALRALGRLDEALASYDEALAIKPGFVEALHNRGNVLKDLGRPEEALASYDQALAVRPGLAEALRNRADLLKELGRPEEALASYDQALAIRPDDAEALNIRAATLLQQGRPQEALTSCDRALAIKSDFVEALNNRAVALGQLGRPEEALASFDRALELKPDYVPALSNRGKALLDLYRAERSEEALASFDKALAINPDDAGILINQAHALSQLGRPQDALTSSDHALAVRPNSPEALNNRAIALVGLSRLEEALASHTAAIAIRPDFAEAHWNEALCRLSLGDYATGWEKYEWRWRCKFMAKAKPDFAEPLWLGKEDLSGRTVFLHAEQGLGDTLQFCRYAPAVAAKGATVTLGVPASLKSLLRTLPGVEHVVSEHDPSRPFDFHCPLMSLPLAFGTRLETIPAPVPYLWANPFRAAAWQERLAKLGGIKVGLVWAGSGKVRVVDLRLTRLEQMQQFGAVDGVTLVSLQKGEPASQTRSPPPGLAIHDWTDELTDFADTAALIAALDLVISVDTAVAHLAGALGKKVWVLLNHSPDWRWLLDRQDTPWYPTMRLFTQPVPGDWATVLRRVSSELRDFATDRLTLPAAGPSPLPRMKISDDPLYRPPESSGPYALQRSPLMAVRPTQPLQYSPLS